MKIEHFIVIICLIILSICLLIPDKVAGIINDIGESFGIEQIVSNDNTDDEDTAGTQTASGAFTQEEIIHMLITGTPEEVIKALPHLDDTGKLNESYGPMIKKDRYSFDFLHKSIFSEALTYNQHEESIQLLINAGAQINQADADGVTPIMAAARNPNVNILRTLIDAGAVINVPDQKGNTALMVAAEHNENPEVIQLLLDRGSLITAENAKKRTALMFAKKNPSAEVIRLLIQAGSDVNAPDKEDKNEPVFVYYIKHNTDLDIARLLFEAGANKDYKNHAETNLLMLATENNPNPEMIKLLIESGVKNNNTRGDYISATGCYYALRNPNPGMIQLYIDMGCKPNKRDELKKTIMIEAGFWAENTLVVNALLEAGGDFTALDKFGYTALMKACYRNEYRPDVFKMILNATKDKHVSTTKGKVSFINAQDEDGDSALITLASSCPRTQKDCMPQDYEYAKLLLDAGADPNLQDRNNQSALSHAVERNRTELIKTLLMYRHDKKVYEEALKLAIEKAENDIIAIFEKSRQTALSD